MNTPALELNNVTAGYAETIILHALSLSIQQGELVGILGPNGAGKTTLLRCVTGLCPRTSGSVSIFGTPLDTLSPRDRARLVAVVPQSVETPMPFTVAEMVMMGRTSLLSPWGAPTTADRDAIDRAMAYADLSDLRDRPITALSAGERQRTLVAMALAQEPKMILLDEATSHLDINHRLDILHILARLNQESGVTVVMISHDLNMTADFCSRVVLMEQGRIAADGAPNDVMTEEKLSAIYRCQVRVTREPVTGSVVVVPVMR